MPTIRKLVDRTKNIPLAHKINTENGYVLQLKTLKKLLQKAELTDFGKRYGFSEILKHEDFYQAFKNNVPLADYSDMLPWWKKAREGKRNVTWPGKINHYALSSGTSDGSTKYIPVSREMLRCMRKASIRQILSIANSGIPKEIIFKKWLMIGGSTDLEYNGLYYSGDLSGITTGTIPVLFQKFSKPTPEIRRERDWKEKIHKITLEAKNWDVGMVAGVPAWIKLLFENIIEHYKLDSIHDLWPNLQVYVHGGVSIAPYKNGLQELMGKPVHYFESYLASEGYVSFQNRIDNNGGMRMLLKNGIFYEFIPFNSQNFNSDGALKDNPETLGLNEVDDKTNYAIVLNTCAGAWRYLLGDTVQFTDLSRSEIKITGRTKHYISLCGEHLSVDNMNQAIESIAKEFNLIIDEYTLIGIPYEGFFAHEWYIGVKEEISNPIQIKEKLDFALKILNDDYRVERMAALKEIIVNFIPNKVFIDYLESKGKIGSQNKFPRVIKDEEAKRWKDFVDQNTRVVSSK